MIGQCLSNKNENATISKFKKFCEMNKAWIDHFSPVVHITVRDDGTTTYQQIPVTVKNHLTLPMHSTGLVCLNLIN